jgi:rhodanese-related sulfurtransferase
MKTVHRRLVTQTPPAAPAAAARHFRDRLAFETDPADVYADLSAHADDPGFVLVDTRSRAAYAEERLPGAINLQPAEMDQGRVAALPDVLLVTYCWSVSCNASTKGAARLAELGRPVKEMIGGLAAWKAEGYPTERG